MITFNVNIFDVYVGSGKGHKSLFVITGFIWKKNPKHLEQITKTTEN